MIHRSFFFGPTELKAIRKHLPFDLQKSSNFEVLLMESPHPNEVVRLSCISAIRGQQGGGLQVPPGYYGNTFAYPAAISKAGLLCKNPLEYAIELFRRLKTQVNDEYIKSVADLMVLKGRPHFTSAWNFLIADVTRAGLGDVDFGWGKPIYAGPTGAIPYIISMYSRFRNNGIVVPIWLPSPAMDRFRQVLLKMTQEPADAYIYGTDDHYPKRIACML